MVCMVSMKLSKLVATPWEEVLELFVCTSYVGIIWKS